MQTLIYFYTIVTIVFWAYHDIGVTFMMIVFSAFIAIIPISSSFIVTSLTIIAMLKFTFFPADSNYDSDFVLVSILYAPFHYIAFADNLADFVKFLFKY